MAKKRQQSLHEQFGEDAVPVLRNVIADQAEKIKIPDRFMVKSVQDEPAVIVYDTVTKRQLKVGLCDYFGVRKALMAFFD